MIRIKSILYLLLPVFTLSSGILVDPVGQIKANAPTIAIFEFIYILIIIVHFLAKNNKIIKKPSVINIIISVFFLYAVFIVEGTVLLKLSYICVIIFSYVYSIGNENEGYKKSTCLLVSYLFLSCTIYIIRAQHYGLDFNVLRGGANIWGGSTLVSAIYLLIAIQSILGKSHNLILGWSILALLLSFIFMSRVCIVTSIILVIFQIKSIKTIPYLSSMIILLSGFLYFTYYEVLFDFFIRLKLRFGFSTLPNNVSYLEFFSPQRYQLWNEALELISSNWLGYGIGGLRHFSHYTDTHNLFINNIFDTGVVFGLIINILLLVPIYKIVNLNLGNMHKLIGILAYSSYILNSIVSGLTLIQVNSYVSAYSLILIFFIFNLLKLKKSVQ
jgi:hypothetical protein